jgi:hypothetical protein
MYHRITKWRVLSPSAQIVVDPASGARAIIRDTRVDGANRFYWSAIPSKEALPIASGRTGEIERARWIAEVALSVYAADLAGSFDGSRTGPPVHSQGQATPTEPRGTIA